MNTPEKKITRKDIAQIYGVDVRTVDRWRRRYPQAFHGGERIGRLIFFEFSIFARMRHVFSRLYHLRPERGHTAAHGNTASPAAGLRSGSEPRRRPTARRRRRDRREEK